MSMEMYLNLKMLNKIKNMKVRNGENLSFFSNGFCSQSEFLKNQSGGGGGGESEQNAFTACFSFIDCKSFYFQRVACSFECFIMLFRLLY